MVYGRGLPRGTVTQRELVTPAETLIGHLVRLIWLEESDVGIDANPGLRVTDLGRALLRDAESGTEQGDDVSVVILGREDPLAYPILVGQLASAGSGLLVDPYLEVTHLHRIVVSTQLTRVLVSGHARRRGEVEAMRAYLDSPSVARRLEVRSSTELHDRVLLADQGDVMTLGTSLNGVGRKTTVLAPLPSPAREALRQEYDRLWMEATLVGPVGPVSVQPGGPDEDDSDGETNTGEG